MSVYLLMRLCDQHKDISMRNDDTVLVMWGYTEGLSHLVVNPHTCHFIPGVSVSSNGMWKSI